MFIILQIFFATRVVSKIGEYSRIFPSFSWGIFGHVTRLDQPRERKYVMDYKYTLYASYAMPFECIPYGNIIDKWDIPRYATRKRCITTMPHKIQWPTQSMRYTRSA